MNSLACAALAMNLYPPGEFELLMLCLIFQMSLEICYLLFI